eukprot:8935-Heterococcus_DN1.PRE.2
MHKTAAQTDANVSASITVTANSTAPASRRGCYALAVALEVIVCHNLNVLQQHRTENNIAAVAAQESACAKHAVTASLC